MVESKNKTTTRAKLAHKLAKYYRATPINLSGTKGQNQPSASHLSTTLFIQFLEELPKEDLETKLKPGTQLMTKKSVSKEMLKNPKPIKAENQSNQDQSSFSFQVSTKEEELLFLNLFPQEIF